MGEANSEKSLVPRLRFQKFSEEWRTHQMGEIAEIFKGKGIAKSDIRNDGIHPCIRYGELYTVYGELVTEVVSRTSLPATDLFFGESNDVIIPSSGETKEDIATAACVFPGGIAFGSDLNVLRTKENGVFLSYCLNGPLRKGIARVAQGDSVVHLYPHQIEKLPIAIPVRSEQQKIADCLSSLDELITVETQKLDTLKTHKKGLMQQLFPREGETIPRLRFPEFREAREWSTKRLGNIGRVIRGASPRPKDDPRYYGGPVPRLMVQDVTRDGKWVTPQIDSLTLEGAKLSRPCPAGTLTIVCSGTVGVVSFLAVDACIHDGFLALVDIDESIATKDFLFHSLNTLREQFEKGATHGGVFTNLTTSGIELFEISCPSPSEQQRISACLSALDDIITTQSQRINALKTHKKGLMQQLFPVQEEVLT